MKHIDDKTIWGLVTGDLVGTEEAAALEHLRVCPECQQEHEVISLIHQESFSAPGEHPSLRFSKSVMEKIDTELNVDQSVQYWMTFTKYAILSALSVAVVSCLILLGFDNTYYLNGLDHLGSLMLTLVITCFAVWIFFIFDRVLFMIYTKKHSR